MIPSTKRRFVPLVRLPAGLAAFLAVGLVLATITAAPASAAAYRYWSYWQGSGGAWVAAQTGPGEYQLVDQDVQGWRFGITSDAPSQTPDNAPDFAALCPDLSAAEAPEGQLRVAVVVDAGFAADAPQGQTPPADSVRCVTVPDGSTGNQALAAAGEVEVKSGLVCAINGYPQGECGAEVSDDAASAAASAAASEDPNPAAVASESTVEGTGFSPMLLVAGVMVVGMVAAAVVMGRRRRLPEE